MDDGIGSVVGDILGTIIGNRFLMILIVVGGIGYAAFHTIKK